MKPIYDYRRETWRPIAVWKRIICWAFGHAWQSLWYSQDYCPRCLLVRTLKRFEG